MIQTLLIAVTTLMPLLVVTLLLALAAWRDRRRATAVARQIRLTDAIAGELGAVVAPVVRKPIGGAWRVEMAVPLARPALVARLLAIAHDTLAGMPGRAEIVLTPQRPAVPAGDATPALRHLRAA